MYGWICGRGEKRPTHTHAQSSFAVLKADIYHLLGKSWKQAYWLHTVLIQVKHRFIAFPSFIFYGSFQGLECQPEPRLNQAWKSIHCPFTDCSSSPFFRSLLCTKEVFGEALTRISLQTNENESIFFSSKLQLTGNLFHMANTGNGIEGPLSLKTWKKTWWPED